MAKTNSSLPLPSAGERIKLHNLENRLRDEKLLLANYAEELKLEIFALGEKLPVQKTSKIFLDELYVQHPFLNFEMKKEFTCVDGKKESNKILTTDSSAEQDEEDKTCFSALTQTKRKSKDTNGVKEVSNQASALVGQPLSIRSRVKIENAPTKGPSKPKVTKPRGLRVPMKDRIESFQPQRITRSQTRKEATISILASSSGLLGENNIDSTGDKKALKSSIPREDNKRKYTRKVKIEAAPLDISAVTKIKTERYVVVPAKVEMQVDSTTGNMRTSAVAKIEQKSPLLQEDKKRKHTRSKKKKEMVDLPKATMVTSTPIQTNTDRGRNCNEAASTVEEHQESISPMLKSEAVLMDYKSTLAQSKVKLEVIDTFDLYRAEKDTGGSTNIDIKEKSKNTSKAEKQVESMAGSKGTCNAILIDHRSTLQQEHKIPKHPQQKWETEVDSKFDLVTATNYTDKSIPMQVESTTERNGTSGSILIEHEFTLPQEDVKRKYTQSEERDESATSHSYSEPKAKKFRESHVQNIQHQSNITKDITGELLADRSLPEEYNKQGVSIQSKARSDVGPLTAALVPDMNLRSSTPENSQSNSVSDDSIGCVFQPGPRRIYTLDEKIYMSQVLRTSPKDIQATLMDTINQIESKVYTFPFNLDALKPETLKFLLNATFAYVKYNYHPKYVKLDDYIIDYN